MRVHFEERHKTVPLTNYEHLWKLSNFEHAEMKKIWANRGKVTAKRAKKSKIPPLVISENHRARIPNTFVDFVYVIFRKTATHNFFSDDNDTGVACHLTGNRDSSISEAERSDMSGCEGVDEDLMEVLDDEAEEMANFKHKGPHEKIDTVPEGQDGGETVAIVAEEEKNLPADCDTDGRPENFEMANVVSLIDNVSFLSCCEKNK
jgi:hypothetical protein